MCDNPRHAFLVTSPQCHCSADTASVQITRCSDEPAKERKALGFSKWRQLKEVMDSVNAARMDRAEQSGRGILAPLADGVKILACLVRLGS